MPDYSNVIKVTSAQERKIIAREGDNFNLVIAVKNPDNTNFDFDGYSAKMQIKPRRVETDDPILTFSIGDGIVLTDGQINLSKSAASMQGKSGSYFYDLKITDSNQVVTTWLFGVFELQPTITF
jgi:hypothetical protein